MSAHDHQWNVDFVRAAFNCRCGATVTQEEAVEALGHIGSENADTTGAVLTYVWEQKAAIARGMLNVEISNAQLRHTD